MKNTFKDKFMGLNHLAEAIILQSIEDLWNPLYNEESFEFFKGNGFKVFVEIAGLNPATKSRILMLVGGKLEKVGNEINVTREQKRQIEKKMLKKLRYPSRCNELKALI